MVISKYKCDASGGFRCETIIICTSSVCKNVIKKFVIAVLLLEKTMILLRGTKCNFIEQNF